MQWPLIAYAVVLLLNSVQLLPKKIAVLESAGYGSSNAKGAVNPLS
jgi:hypothetical protein